MSFNTKVVHEQGGNLLSVKSGGVLNIESGGQVQIDGADVTSSVAGAAVAGAAAGYKIARGVGTLDGSNPTPITTGLATIVSAVACFKGSVALGDDPNALTVDFTGSDGTLNVYAWKNTSGTDPTQVASTDSSRTFCWIAVGT